MGFTTDFSKTVQPNGLKPEGDYEVIITNVQERKTQSNKLYLNFSMVIRNDVEQEYQNGFLFHTLWKRKDPTPADQQVNDYGFGQIMAVAKAAQLPNGKDYPDMNALLQDLVGKPIRVSLEHNKRNGKLREEISYISPTFFPELHHVMKKPKTDITADDYAKPQTSYANTAPAAATPNTLLDDDDVPF